MIGDLLNRLRGRPETRPLPELDANLAMGALFVRVAKSDRHYAVVEIAMIDRLLAHRFALNPVEAAKMRADCERLEAAAPETGNFSEMVRAHVAYDARAALYDALWQVSMADGQLRPEERSVLDQTAETLGVTAEDIALATNRHQQGRGGNDHA